MKVPPTNVYRIHLFNAEGKVERIHLFCSETYTSNDLSQLFSELELDYIKKESIDIVFSPLLIHSDDSIRTIKLKIVQEFQRNNILVGLEELYLFTEATKTLSMNAIYQKATQNDMVPFTKELFFQYALHLQLDPFSAFETNATGERIDLLEKNVFDLDDWTSLAPSETHQHKIYIPLGMKFQEEYDFSFSAHPYQNHIWKEQVRYQMDPKNPLLIFENTLLLNYTISTNIYVCLAKNTLLYANTHEIDQDYMCLLYYPFLKMKNITTLDLLNGQTELVKETKKQITKVFDKKNEIIDTFYLIHWNRKTDLVYKVQGIRTYHIKMKSSIYNKTLPLDIVFKNIHATAETPFIKYNPGIRRENMYRLYSTKISANGKKIPVLDKSLIKRLIAKMARRDQLSIYIQGEHDVFLSMDSKSNIEISGELPTPISSNELEIFLQKTVSPILDKLNHSLYSTGYVLQTYQGLRGSHIIDSRYTYEIQMKIENKIVLENQTYLTFLMNIMSSNILKQAYLQYKRVENFKIMDSQSAIITEVYHRTGNYRDVIEALMTNFQMTEDEAVSRYTKFLDENQVLNEKIIENPGFGVMMKMVPLKDEVLIVVEDILSLEYVDVLPIYLDTFLRMTQDPKSTDVPKDILNKFKIDKQKIDKLDEPVVENVVAAVEIPKMEEKSVFILDETDSNHQQLEFDYDYDYEFEEEGEGEGEGEEEVDQYEYGGSKSEEVLPKGEKYVTDWDGMSIKNPTPFFRKMQDLEPTLFLDTTESVRGEKFDLYSTTCPSTDKRQPIILTEEEKRHIDETNPGSYSHALKYGSDPKNPYYYICPRYWCLKTNSSISKKDAEEGEKCGKIIPRGSKTIPKGHYVYEFAHPKKHFTNGVYIDHTPGFLETDKHPKGLTVPCCYKKEWDSEFQRLRRLASGQYGLSGNEEGVVVKKEGAETITDGPLAKTAITYIIGPVSYPLPPQRWGFLPMSIQLFLGTDNSLALEKGETAKIKNNTPCVLRYGVERSDNQSFLACMAYFYAFKQNLEKVPSVVEMRNIIADAITLDHFIKYQNGNLPAIFRPKVIDDVDMEDYVETQFYKSIDLQNQSKVDYLTNTIAAYENFLDFLKDETSVINHSYLWDAVCDRNDNLMKDGFNLVILKVIDRDITERVQMVCPSNSYTSVKHDNTKITMVLLQQDVYYEPIHIYEQYDVIANNGKSGDISYLLKPGDVLQKDKVIDSKKKVVYTFTKGDVKKLEIVPKRGFNEADSIPMVKHMLELIQNTRQKYCAPLPSMPRVYEFKQNIPISKLIELLETMHYTVVSQVVNYRNKAIGVQVIKQEGQNPLFVPCFPSAIVDEMPSIFMDEDTLWIDYKSTRDRLINLATDSQRKIPCKPVIKIVEDNLVVGFLTETNQFVQVNPPEPNLDEDGIKVINHSNFGKDATSEHPDKELAMNQSADEERKQITRKIKLETQFYNVFRTLIRQLLNEYEHRQIRKNILREMEDVAIDYYGKLEYIEQQLVNLTKDAIAFQEFDVEKWEDFDEIVNCKQDKTGKCQEDELETMGENKKFCLSTEDGCITIFPKKNLLSENDNQQVYFGRMADELLRYKRIRLFMFQPKQYLNLTSSQFRIHDNELFLLESVLNDDYFRDLVPYNVNTYIQNIEYDNANPSITQVYKDELSLEEQDALLRKEEKRGLADYIQNCILETRPRVIGNEKAGSWKPYFPNTVSEMIFNNSVPCSFIPMIYILQDLRKTNFSINDVKKMLWNGYRTFWEKYPDKITVILRNQGKRDLMEQSKTEGLELVLFSDSYYITDLDWWVLANSEKLPIVLFSSTSMKYLTNTTINWIRIGSSEKNEKYYFVRCPVNVKSNLPSNYHVLNQAFEFGELRGDMFIRAEQGDEKYRENMQTLDEYMRGYTLIPKIKK
jgi:hypothetical protein